MLSALGESSPREDVVEDKRVENLLSSTLPRCASRVVIMVLCGLADVLFWQLVLELVRGIEEDAIAIPLSPVGRDIEEEVELR